MILFIINGYFLDDAGFSKRCQKEIDMLSQNEKVVVLSRDPKEANKKYHNKQVQIVNFTVKEELVETPKNYRTGWYEIYRNSKLFFPLLSKLIEQIRKYHKEKLLVYIISSPMTVPVFCLFVLKFFRIKNIVLEFHDLEPEMAIAIKNLKKTSIILKIEYVLEKFICRTYEKILVTTNTQKEILKTRNAIPENKIFTLPNSINNVYHAGNEISSDTMNLAQDQKVRIFPRFTKEDFVIGYISSMTFAYTVTDVCALLIEMSPVFRRDKHLKFIIIGDGDMLYRIKQTVAACKLEKQVIITGKIANAQTILDKIDLGVIPLAENAHTRSVLPTRLFEYFAAKKAVIVPNFPSFKEIIVNYTNGLLYTSIDDLVKKIIELKENLPERNRLARNGYDLFVHTYALNHYSQSYRKFLYEDI